MQLVHLVPASSLVNGVCYNAVVYVYENNDVESPPSFPIIFYCFTTPDFHFSNLSPNDVIRNSSFTPMLAYSQPEDELLNSYQIILYNDAGTELRSTGVRFDDSLTTTVSGLSESVQYKLRGIGETVNGFKIDTGLIPFSVHYLQPDIYSRLLLKNDERNGVIEYVSNIISIEGKSIPDPATYIDGEMIDLRQEGSNVIFDEGFSFAGNYIIRCAGKSFPINKPLLILSDRSNSMQLLLRKSVFASEGNQERLFFELSVQNNVFHYQTYGDLMEPADGDPTYFFWIKCINGHYTVRSSVLGGGA